MKKKSRREIDKRIFSRATKHFTSSFCAKFPIGPNVHRPANIFKKDKKRKISYHKTSLAAPSHLYTQVHAAGRLLSLTSSQLIVIPRAAYQGRQLSSSMLQISMENNTNTRTETAQMTTATDTQDQITKLENKNINKQSSQKNLMISNVIFSVILSIKQFIRSNSIQKLAVNIFSKLNYL